MGIPGLSDSQVMKIIQRSKQASHEQDGSNGNVQILGQLDGAYKNQLVAIAKAGLGKMQLRQNEQERERSRRKWQEFLKLVWGATHCQMAEGMRELSNYILIRVFSNN